MLSLRRTLVEQIVEQAFRDHPIECCGVISGPTGSDRAERLVPMTNAAASPTFFEFDSRDLLRLYSELERRDERLLVIYHSHTSSAAYPSRTDIAFAGEPEAHYLLVSTRDGQVGGPEMRSLRIVDGTVTEEPIRVIDG